MMRRDDTCVVEAVETHFMCWGQSLFDGMVGTTVMEWLCLMVCEVYCDEIAVLYPLGKDFLLLLLL